MLLRSVLPFLALGAAPALADSLTIEIVNNSGADVTEFYASPVGEDSWQANMLATGPITAGSAASLALGDAAGCAYDFRMVFADGDVLEQAGNDVCALSRYTLN